MANQQGSFLDKNTVMAIVMVVGCWVLWQSYMQKKYPPKKTKIEKPLAKQEKSEDTLELGQQEPIKLDSESKIVKKRARDQI